MTRIQGTLSHATVIGGRYLLTHNHFGLPLSQLLLFNRNAAGGFTGVSVLRVDGTALLDQAPLDSFVVVEERGETLLLDFGEVAGQGIFDTLGIPSASVARGGALPLRAGMEVAPVDWDGEGHTRVYWAPLLSVYEKDGLLLAVWTISSSWGLPAAASSSTDSMSATTGGALQRPTWKRARSARG